MTSSKYAPLHEHLRAARGHELPMTLAEIERVLGFRLPASARNYPAWWSNNHHNPAVNAWRMAGWRTARVDLGRERLVFVRDEAVDVRRDKDDPIHLDPKALSPAALNYFRREAVQAGGVAEAVTRFINAEIASPRKQLLDRFAARSPRLMDDSTPLIREDRDGR